MTATLAARWHALLVPLLPAAAAREAELARPVAAYNAPERHYHTLQHLQNLLDKVSGFALQDAAVVELAIWYHDAVYNALRSDNEAKSAEWAQQFLRQTSLAPARRERVADLILRTADHTQPQQPDDPDLLLFLDADLSILGAPEAAYWAYARQVRREYRLVPDLLYRPGAFPHPRPARRPRCPRPPQPQRRAGRLGAGRVAGIVFYLISCLMPITISGFIEVAFYDDELNDPDSWRYCVDVSPFPLWTDDVCSILFGISKSAINWPVVAGTRGIPPSVGLVAASALAEVLAYQGADKAYGFTYITYEELKKIVWHNYPTADLSELQTVGGGWYSLFRVMDALSGRFLEQRLTVWFN